jgi:hypothetical protein
VYIPLVTFKTRRDTNEGRGGLNVEKTKRNFSAASPDFFAPTRGY